MKKNLFVKQQGGLGDIMFIQKLCKELSKTYEVYHPVTYHMWISGIDQLTTNVSCGYNIDIPKLSTKHSEKNPENILVLDLSNQACEGPHDIMKCKYRAVDIDWSDWSKYFTYNRDHDREKSLKELLGIRDGEPYILHNMWYSFNKPHHGVDLSIPEDYDGKIVYMNPSHTSKVFDWCWILENAEQIHTVDTCINCIVETLDLKADTLVCHPRHYKNTEDCLRDLFKAPWQWVEYEEWLWREKVPKENL